MTQKRFSEKLATRLQWDESKISEVLNVISNILSGQLSENNVISIENFGTFSTQKNREYILVDSETVERYLMPPEVVVIFEPYVNDSSESDKQTFEISFEPEDSLKNSINISFHNFEPTLINEGVEFPGVEVISTKEPDVSSDVSNESVITNKKIPKTQDESRLRPKSRSRSGSNILIPVLGGVAIVLATLFFFRWSGKPEKR